MSGRRGSSKSNKPSLVLWSWTSYLASHNSFHLPPLPYWYTKPFFKSKKHDCHNSERYWNWAIRFFSPLSTNGASPLIWCLPIYSGNYGFSESELVGEIEGPLISLVKVSIDFNKVVIMLKESDYLEKFHAFITSYTPVCSPNLFWCKHIDLNYSWFICLNRAKNQIVHGFWACSSGNQLFCPLSHGSNTN